MRNKILLFILSCMLLGSVVRGQYVNIPDSNFRTWLVSKYPTCFNGAGMLDTTSNIVLTIDTIGYYSQLPFSITNLSGIQYFKRLKYLYCGGDWDKLANLGITNIPSLPNSLIYFNCENNLLINLPKLPDSLVYLNCEYNSLVSLPSLPNSLVYLHCGLNVNLYGLPALPNTLRELYCNGGQIFGDDVGGVMNGLTSLPILPNELRILSCEWSNLTNLPTHLPDSLLYLNCGYNLLTSLPNLPDSIQYLNCDYTQITSLPALPNVLTSLDCSYNFNLLSLPLLPDLLRRLACKSNPFSSLPVLPKKLYELYCNSNLLSSLPALPKNLHELYCDNNKLTSLPELPDSLMTLSCLGNGKMHCLPKLPSKLKNLSVSSARIHCISNLPNGCIITDNYKPINIPLCNPTNNLNQCESFPVIAGRIFSDNNSNGIKDNNEFYRRKISVLLSNGNYSYTNDSGYFQIGADSIGAYTLTIQAPNLYAALPSSINYNFSRYDTLVLDTIALQAAVIKDSIALHIYSMNWGARIGRSFPYLISYENVGTTILNPAINFNYDSSRLVYDSSNAVVINNGNNLILNTSGFVPGQVGSFIAYFTVKSNAVLGDTIKANASITGSAANATDNVYTIIRGSYDPNDKEATSELTSAQVANGKDIDYTIRFQNTGNDTAFHVVIADTLSSLLQVNTLEMVASSHNCKTTVKDGIAYFEMRDILLPDSNTNEIKSHGFVRFKVKPVSTLVNGDSVNNKASIYFDYNKSVLTNTVTTKIKNPVIVPLKLLSFDGNVLENGNNELHWNTENEINTRAFIIQRSGDGRVFASIGEVVAKGSGEYRFTDNRLPLTADRKPLTVFYRLIIRDNDGSFSFSKIIFIKSEMGNPKFEIGSNPVKDRLVLSNISNSLINTEASLVNSAGVVVKRFVIHAATETVNMSGLSSGVYYLRTVDGSRKVVVSS